MSRIRSTNTSIDLRMKTLLSQQDMEFVMYPKMYGHPDFILSKKKIAIFCDGDFWHGYKYGEKKKPAKKYWKDKIENNMKRDVRISRKLRREGWAVLRIWEHDIKKRPEACVKKIEKKFFSKCC